MRTTEIVAVILNHTPPAANLVSCSDKWAVMQCLCGLSRLIFQHISRRGTSHLREFHQIISISTLGAAPRQASTPRRRCTVYGARELARKLMALAQWVITVLMDLSSAVLTKSHYTCFHHLRPNCNFGQKHNEKMHLLNKVIQKRAKR